MQEKLRKMKILVVHSHPGDLACEGSGTIALHTRRGDEVHCLLLSDGERHHNDLIHAELDKAGSDRDPAVLEMTVDDIKALKRAEAEQMCELLGIRQLYAFGWPDVLWACTHERIDQIARIVRKVKPDVILGHMPWGGRDPMGALLDS